VGQGLEEPEKSVGDAMLLLMIGGKSERKNDGCIITVVKPACPMSGDGSAQKKIRPNQLPDHHDPAAKFMQVAPVGIMAARANPSTGTCGTMGTKRARITLLPPYFH